MALVDVTGNAPSFSGLGDGMFHNFDFRNVDKFRRSQIEDPLANEPTYLTFGIDIDTTNELGLDNHTGLVPNPLFNTNSLNSAYQFLRQRNYDYKADKLYEFIELMNIITKKYPWYLDSIAGVKDLWKNNMDIKKGFAMDKVKVTFTTLESLNLNVTRLADLYREFSYDMLYRRQILPDNLQWFKMKIIIAEYRNLYLDMEDYKIEGYNYLEQYKNYLEFDCDLCTFDFSESLPFDNLSSSHIGNTQGPAMNKFSINVGMVVEKHNFGLAYAYYGSKAQQDAEAAADQASQSAPESSENNRNKLIKRVTKNSDGSTTTNTFGNVDTNSDSYKRIQAARANANQNKNNQALISNQ